MRFVEIMKNKAKEYQNRLVLPESTDERTLRAARAIVDMQIVSELYLVGNQQKVEEACKKIGVSIDGFKIVDPELSEWAPEFAEALYEKRKAKGMTPEQAKKDMYDPLRFGAMMLVKKIRQMRWLPVQKIRQRMYSVQALPSSAYKKG